MQQRESMEKTAMNTKF